MLITYRDHFTILEILFLVIFKHIQKYSHVCNLLGELPYLIKLVAKTIYQFNLP